MVKKGPPLRGLPDTTLGVTLNPKPLNPEPFGFGVLGLRSAGQETLDYY